MGKSVSVSDDFTVNGELLDFDNVNVTTNLNGNLLDKVNVVAALGGEYTNTITTDVLDKIQATIHGTLNGEFTNRVTTDILDKIAANLAATFNSDFLDKINANIAASVNSDVLDKVNANVGISASVKELAPLLLTLLWTEIPIIKFRIPHDYIFGFRFFGIEFFSVRFRGESKAVTAKNPAGATGGTDV
jgi:hypothetical protein